MFGKVILGLACLLLLMYLLYVAFPPGTPYALPEIVKAWQNPARQDVASASIEAMFELQSSIVLMLVLGVPAAFGALVMMALGGDRRR